MPKSTVVNLRLSPKQLKQLDKLTDNLSLDRSSVLRLALARLVDDDAARLASAKQRALAERRDTTGR